MADFFAHCLHYLCISSQLIFLDKIFRYLESKPQHWCSNHNVLVKDIENVNKMKMCLNVTHTINFQNYKERNREVRLVIIFMNILTTVFLRYDNEKIFYPNSVLATKPISNFYRSPEMQDSVEFSVDVSTSIESIGALKAKLKAYVFTMLYLK